MSLPCSGDDVVVTKFLLYHLGRCSLKRDSTRDKQDGLVSSSKPRDRTVSSKGIAGGYYLP